MKGEKSPHYRGPTIKPHPRSPTAGKYSSLGGLGQSGPPTGPGGRDCDRESTPTIGPESTFFSVQTVKIMENRTHRCSNGKHNSCCVSVTMRRLIHMGRDVIFFSSPQMRGEYRMILGYLQRSWLEHPTSMPWYSCHWTPHTRILPVSSTL